MIRHILFDCFGTLIYTGKSSITAVKEILQSVNAENVDADEFYAGWKRIKRRMMNESVFRCEQQLYEESLEVLFGEYGIEADAEIEVRPMLKALVSEERIAYPEVEDVLRQIEKMGMDYAIASTTDNAPIECNFRRSGLSFERIYSSEDMQVYKPARRFYETILAGTGWLAEECVFVGDNYLDDVCGPQSFGIRAVLLDRKGKHSGTLLNPKPWRTISSLGELPELLEHG